MTVRNLHVRVWPLWLGLRIERLDPDKPIPKEPMAPCLENGELVPPTQIATMCAEALGAADKRARRPRRTLRSLLEEIGVMADGLREIYDRAFDETEAEATLGEVMAGDMYEVLRAACQEVAGTLERLKAGERATQAEAELLNFVQLGRDYFGA